MSNINYIDRFFDGCSQIINRISREDIDKAIDLLYGAYCNGNQVFTMGNGGSASTATHFAGDLNVATAWAGPKRFKAFSLVDNIPQVSALINDCGWENLYIEQLKNYLRPKDIVMAISVHGGSGKDRAGVWSQNLLKALQYAKDNDAKTIALSGFDGGPMKELADVSIVVPYETTPHVEAFHVVLHHLITFCLKEKAKSCKEAKV